MARTEVRNFAEIMEEKLQKNDYKGGWKECGFNYLFQRLIEEVAELSVINRDEGFGTDSYVGECADIANFAMMIADNFGERDLKLEANNAKDS